MPSTPTPSRLYASLCALRNTILERSQQTRAAYLASLPTAPTPRTSLGCANLAHTTATQPPAARRTIALHRAPHLGIITAYNDMLSAHQPFATYPQRIAAHAKGLGATVQVAGGTPAMCDGITQGREGMELSLFSRDVIALSACVGLAHDVFDGGILLGVCDKIAPGLLMGALAFGHLPFVFIPAGPMGSGLPNAEKARIRKLAAQGKASRDVLLAAEEAAYHSSGTCTFYGTANSNQLLLDFMGLQFPGGAFEPPNSPQRQALVQESVRALVAACGQAPLRLSALVNAESLVNALVGLMASGGSTNHTIHWLAVARAAGFIINWDDLDTLARLVPLLCRIYPNGSADVNAFHAAGGTAALMATLLDAGLLFGEAPTLWGTPLHSTVAQVLPSHECFATAPPTLPQPPGPTPVASQANRDPNLEHSQVLRPAHAPFQPEGGIRLLQGNLGRAVCKVSAVKPEHCSIQAPCRVFADQHEVINAFERGELTQDMVVVVRGQGPRANGMPELHKLTPILASLQDLGLRVALLTDGRMSGASGAVLAAIHVHPEAWLAGPIGHLQTGDVVCINANTGELSTPADVQARLNVQKTEKSNSQNPEQNQGLGQALSHGRGYFALWRERVGSAEEGASVVV